jgi:mxaJ protein
VHWHNRVLRCLTLLLAAGCASSPQRTLRVCADPNNLPFSNEREEGFENRLADLIARDLEAKVEYTWWAQRRGFARNTLNAGACDLILGVPSTYELAQTTRPYYRSSYMFVTRRGQAAITSLDDPKLRALRVGVQVIGDDYSNSPPAHALSNRGIVTNVRGYSVLGDYRQPNPPARILSAVADGEVDVAIVWGPLAGYFVKERFHDLQLHPVTPQIDPPFLPFVFDISMAVRRGDTQLLEQIDSWLQHHRADVRRLLSSYGVPLVAIGG